ncbi:SRR1 family protein [Aspergillus clavatus NRRL 1]|uniref:SRR1-like domain-containing protein n=1 Tax=Aspergillus clavatus (strain ATCC 1007 / CBS 513.65 / DSM 816 / NCTC 3887 / NRRL 1 / QM 1276 / 107) TaxID=344612 RepID=A1CAH9_ASPCL|nr:uncharacterized protein ACLA_011740 [Aspergillus clavatus NRRL 1]EAW12747.1 conserved hypothetical protein [Aspergillus clavatus NRRL 1]
MPHTNRPKKPQAEKRLEVTDIDGWTHVTTTKNVRRALRRSHPKPHTTQAAQQQEQPTLTPAEAPSQTTLETLQKQLLTHREKWESSESWRVTHAGLQGIFADSDPASGAQPGLAVDDIVCVGLGSPSGFLRGGWVDRRDVSLYQLAALASMVDMMRKRHPSVRVYAQDPVFNDLDRSLLDSLGFTVLEHPEGFARVSDRTFLYCPGAERTHLEQLLPANPPLLFGGPLEEIESEVVGRFLGARKSVRVPVFENNEHAFWNMRLYFLERSEE